MGQNCVCVWYVCALAPWLELVTCAYCRNPAHVCHIRNNSSQVLTNSSTAEEVKVEPSVLLMQSLELCMTPDMIVRASNLFVHPHHEKQCYWLGAVVLVVLMYRTAREDSHMTSSIQEC